MIKMWEDVLLMLLLEVMIDVYTFMRIEINEDNDPLCFLSGWVCKLSVMCLMLIVVGHW